MTMPLKIWGRISSINVKKVVWAAQELGLAFERIDAGRAFGNTSTADYLGHNPNGAIPLIDDGGFMLWESNVIVRYLCAKYGAPTLVASRTALPPEGANFPRGGPSENSALSLYPEDLQARFNAERWMDWQQAHLNPAGREAFVQWFRTPVEQRNPALIAASVALTEPYMAMVDQQLAKTECMAGDHFSMADIPIACEIHRWWGLPQPRPPYPHIERWYARMQARPASKGILDLPLS